MMEAAPDHDFPLEIGRPTTGALLHAGYTRLDQLAQVRAADLQKIDGMGPKAIGILRDALATGGLAFAEDGFPATLAQPARRALASGGYTKLEQLNGVSEADLQKLHGMGSKALGQLREALAAQGMSLAEE